MNVSQRDGLSAICVLCPTGNLKELHLPLNAYEPQLLGGTVAVVEEQLLPRLDVSLGKDADPVVPVHHQHLGTAVGVDGVVGKSDLVPLPGRVHHILVVQVEEEGAHVLVVHFAAPVCLVLRDDLSAILRDELVLVRKRLDEDSPTSDVRRCHVQFLSQAALHHYVSKETGK